MSGSADEGSPADVAVPAGDSAELAACTPEPINPAWFNAAATLPYGCTTEHVGLAMNGFLNFLGSINGQLNTKGIIRFEAMLSPANFSSMVGEYAVSTLPDFCPGLVKNRYHNGHPDTLPAGVFAGDSIKHATEGIEVKASRRNSGWQGHNVERCWLMVFVFDANRPSDVKGGVPPRPFSFRAVYVARLEKSDWNFSGRKEGSKRTITASVTGSGRQKLLANWVYVSGGTAPGTKATREAKATNRRPRRTGKPPA